MFINIIYTVMSKNSSKNKYYNNMNIRCDIIRSNHYFDRNDDDDDKGDSFVRLYNIYYHRLKGMT